MATFSGDSIYFDEFAAGIGSGLHHDDSLTWDASFSNIISIESEVDLDYDSYNAYEILDINIESDITIDENYSKYVDLLPLVPAKFRESLVLQQFLEECGLKVGSWIANIADIEKLLDVYNVGEDYLQNLADLINLSLIFDSTTTLEEKRRQLLTAIDWYKVKGTYGALQYILYLQGLTLNIWDLYTNNYTSTWVQEDWFVGKEGENPTGLNSSYYKSPHIGLEIVLNTVYGSGSDAYLFQESMYTNFALYIEKCRPVNVVPHYSVLLNPVTYEDGQVVEVSGEIKCCVQTVWEFTRVYWDEQQLTQVLDIGGDNVIDNSDNNVVVAGSSRLFDDGVYFDYTKNAFINQITHWKLGTGNKGVSPDVSGFDIETPVLSGTIDNTTIYDDRIEFEILVEGSSQTGISELGLYFTDQTTLQVAATFPDINLTSSGDVDLRILVMVYK